MKKNIIILLVLLCSFGAASAQSSLKTAYFMDRMTTRHNFNPALMNEYSYFTLPVIGELNLGINSNLSVDKLLFPLDNGKLGLFVHPEVNTNDFLSRLNENNIIAQDLKLSLFSLGFHGFGGFNTLDLSVRENASLNIKKDLFEFITGGGEDAVYDMAGTGVNAQAWAELGIGHSHRINDNLTIGVKLKYLMGVANANVTLDKFRLETSEDELSLRANAVANVAIFGMPLEGDIEDMSLDNFNPQAGLNHGLGIDLGATYEWNKFNFSMAVVDLGWISWATSSTTSKGVSTSFNGFEDLDIEDIESSTEGALDDFTAPFDNIEDITFERADSFISSLNAKLNIGAEYQFFDTDILTAGLLSTTTFGPVITEECMLATTFRPARWLSMAVSGTVSNYGTYWGWALNWCPRGINIFVGMDSMVTHITPMGIPYTSSNVNLKAGISFALGRIHKVN